MNHKKQMVRSLLLAVAAMSAIATAAHAEADTTKKDDGALTWNGITFYGVIDIGVAHLDHGAKLTSYYGPGLPFVIQKNSGQSITSISPNGLSQSKIGISGVEKINNDDVKRGVQARDRLPADCTRYTLANGPKSLIIDNGVPLASQTTNGDSSRSFWRSS